jgi:hypothetical protein
LRDGRCHVAYMAFYLIQLTMVYRTLSRLPSEMQLGLRILACLPAQGASLDLVARLSSRPVGVVKASFETAGTYGIVRITEGIVAFAHDRHHEAARALVASNERSRFLAKMARQLESEDPDAIFIRADLMTDAMPVDQHDWKHSEICELSEYRGLVFAAGADPADLSARRRAEIYSQRRVRSGISVFEDCKSGLTDTRT